MFVNVLWFLIFIDVKMIVENLYILGATCFKVDSYWRLIMWGIIVCDYTRYQKIDYIIIVIILGTLKKMK